MADAWRTGLEEGFKRRREDTAMSGTGNGTENDIGSNQVEGLDARQTGLVWEGWILQLCNGTMGNQRWKWEE